MRLCAALLLGVVLAAPTMPVAAGPPTPVVIELFTSEGCSDCPAADALLEKLVATQPVAGAEIIALGEHVDYWDRLGWKDRFSSAALTNRQQIYGARFSTESIYTPQMIVDGIAEFVGSDANAARRAIVRSVAAPHGTLTVQLEPSGANRLTVTVTARDLPDISRGDRADFIVALTEDHLVSDVKRGENHGRTLSHTAVVRTMQPIGEAAYGSPSTARGELTIGADWQREAVKVVAFVQQRRGRQILASTAVPLANPPR